MNIIERYVRYVTSTEYGSINVSDIVTAAFITFCILIVMVMGVGLFSIIFSASWKAGTIILTLGSAIFFGVRWIIKNQDKTIFERK